jgi:hypothetical protein
MSGYYSRPYKKYSQQPKYKPKYSQEEKQTEDPVKNSGNQTNFIKTSEEGVQINVGEGIPCRIIPINPEDYPKLLALLNLHQNS